ncbi:hypothetical protein KMW28_03055 [Flammeovirga yaeyamensis]|uniref:Cytochrome c domain-containing protein n=1 Tax=Flammeovirga yaeyamensis TaxID=367791 RepID=A0AAX1N553_9BACT|nr:c-type cytochrome domain-containing protein [Flammeovirga yaeyamensis]MBB3700495.1 putative membrane protein [Flammeovirga yaeyamensis]NMF36883.1 hypothetical protein [Flammeovirga yaeyamensis]QWG02569.1 hypothetical protein KMW28_03055 [Flammeovirga yaeyamensis]
MDFSNFSIFIGRFHPLLVHLPIGFLLLAMIFEVATRFKWLKDTQKVISFTLLVGGISAVGTCILGYLLGQSGSDYNETTLDNHQWGGIITTLIAFGCYFIKNKKLHPFIYPSLLGLLVVVMSYTGHLGGNLTHGSTYLTQYAPIQFGDDDVESYAVATTPEEVIVYGHLVKPILEIKCTSCHNQDKKKGQLSLSSKEDILKGGKNGAFIVSGDAEASSFIQRVSLPHGHEDIMPPEGKKGLSDDEIALVTLWINQGEGSFDTLYSALDIQEELHAYCMTKLGFVAAPKDQITLAEIPQSNIKKLEEKGFQIRELVPGTNAYDITLPIKTNQAKELLHKLSEIKDNIVWLDLKGHHLDDKSVKLIAEFSELRKLNLSKNPITDKGVKSLQQLKHLEVLNLHSTKITEASLAYFEGHESVKKIYSWNSF